MNIELLKSIDEILLDYIERIEKMEGAQLWYGRSVALAVKVELAKVERVENPLLTKSLIDDRSHGSFWDRGSADSYYGRPRDPHRGGVGGDSGPRIVAVAPEEIAAYLAGYEHNEKNGDKKDWG